MLYEMRHYLIDRGRMADNHDRMQNHSPPLLAKHGVRVVGRWAATAGPNLPMYCYIMEWRDFAEREAAWGAFYADPEWPRVRAATNAGFEMVEENRLAFLKPSRVFAEVETERGERLGGLHQLIVQKTAVGRTGEVETFLADVWLPRAQAAGARVMGVLDVASGVPMPAVVILLAWEGAASWFEGTQAFEADADVRAACDAQRREYGRTLLGPADVWTMAPASYALPVASIRTSAPR